MFIFFTILFLVPDHNYVNIETKTDGFDGSQNIYVKHKNVKTERVPEVSMLSSSKDELLISEYDNDNDLTDCVTHTKSDGPKYHLLESVPDTADDVNNLKHVDNTLCAFKLHGNSKHFQKFFILSFDSLLFFKI